MHTPASLIRENGKVAKFRSINKGQTFERGGIVWVKVSTMTAKPVWPAMPDRSVYFVNTMEVYANA